MNSKMRWMLTGALVLCVCQVAAAGSKPKQQTRMPAAYLCAQTQIIGHAAGSYAGQPACNAAKPGLITDAKSDGEGQCRAFCDKLGCMPKTPDTLNATAACRGPDPVNQKWYGAAATPSFECKCTNP